MSSLLSIDPGLVTSGTGLAYFEDGKLLRTVYVPPQKSKLFQVRMDAVLKAIKELHIDADEVVVEESFYPGLANKLHQRTLGVLDYYFQIKTIAPMSVKKFVTGTGKAKKDQIKAVLHEKYFRTPEFQNIIWESEDVVDAVAIGIAFMMRGAV